ncbi:hypothetical protein KAK07_24985 [Ideonella sp. 4Y16]|uniref:hypothetical protein n=1 Tax=Ideonella alba TaxID=2824118 RepID=UPI001B3904C7|nr:hypothetical protein [Ideonella alba]MBQ0946605.1 hypothetical protein [Ideonella alba]
MSKFSNASLLLLGAFACFGLGIAACYVALRPIVRFAEEAPLMIMAEQTSVLKQLRAGQEKELSELLERLVWMQVSQHAEHAKQGKPPLESLRSEFAYHCGRFRQQEQQLPTETREARARWCSTLNA